MKKRQYRKYNLVLDPLDIEDKELIDFIENLHGNKIKNSYSAILKKALKEMEGKLKNDTSR